MKRVPSGGRVESRAGGDLGREIAPIGVGRATHLRADIAIVREFVVGWADGA